MRILIGLAGAALLALSSSALAQGKGHGQGQGGGDAAREHIGGGKDRGGGSHATERGSRGGGGSHAREKDRGFESRSRNPDRQARGSDRRKHDQGAIERGGGKRGSETARADRHQRREKIRGPKDNTLAGKGFERGRGRGNPDRAAFTSVERGGPRAREHGRVFHSGRYRWDSDVVSGWCPPGLAKKGNGCMPPGQARKLIGPAGLPIYGYAPWYSDVVRGDWRYWNGYAYRVDPFTGWVAATMPLLGGALYIGSPWPAAYPAYAVDPYYDRYYGYGPYDYRYASGTLFAVDPTTAAIVSIAALLTGDAWVVGRPMPVGYAMYNVPPPYRARYYDTRDDWYRYSDGYIYRIEPTTLIVRETIVLV